MTVNRDDMVRKLSAKSGYHMKDIRHLLHCMDDVVFEELCNVSPDNEVEVQLVQGVKILCEPVAERARVNPQDRSDIICRATCKVKTRISREFKEKMAKFYDDTYNKNG